MGRRHALIGAAMAVLLGGATLGTVAPPVATAGTITCRVRNITQATAGRSFNAMVAAAVDGDRLTVRGRCLARSVRIEVDVTIRGIGDRRAVLDAMGRGRVMVVPRSATVTLHHLALTGGVAPEDGAGIWNRGTVTLVDSVVRGNRARWAGGISNTGTVTLTDSAVTDNEGGGLYTEGPASSMTIIRTRVSGNAGDGISYGSVGESGPLTITDSVVRRNTGVGVSASGGFTTTARSAATVNSVTLRRSLVARNAKGGIYTYNAADVTVVKTVVRANTGHGIVVRESGMLVRDSVVRDNSGAGITTEYYDCGVTVQGSVVRDNRGGGIRINDGCYGRVIGSTVRGNAARLGGGIYASGEGGLRVEDSSVTGNRANRGGGIWSGFYEGGLLLTGVSVRDNSTRYRGGGIWNQGSELTLDASSVTSNSAGGRGGGILNDGGTVILSGGSAVTGNTPDDCIGTQAC